MTTITVIKLDHSGQEKWRYQGKLVNRDAHRIVLEAYFERDDYPVGELLLRRGDRFVETYFDDRWYNIYEIYSTEQDRLKAWYCNISFPAEIRENIVTYRDLALDLIVFPDGSRIVMDEDEFEALPLKPETLTQARRALEELIRNFQRDLKI